MSLSEALTEVKEALKSGSNLNDELINEIASDYKLNPALLRRKIEENNISSETITAFIAATSENPQERFHKAFDQACRNYGVGNNWNFKHPEFIRKGVRYKAICRDGRGYIMLSFENRKIYKCNETWMHNAKPVENSNVIDYSF